MSRTVTLILGGARSGKSAFAEGLALELSGRTGCENRADAPGVTYVATADSHDSEMACRIERHKSRRPESWRTVEEDPRALPGALAGMGGLILLDCLTMYITRLFLACGAADEAGEEAWARAEREILDAVEAIFVRGPDIPPSHLIAVSNEVGLGLVPAYLMGRRFRDAQGRANQIAASRADNVALIVAGLPIWLKGGF